ncbi:Glycerol kinase [Quillaja saponaria]|uniref:Glycerol kinase n=1 Tax=Quillaja saponaria TaxID=32244 RepID=A0AAD7LZD0_QUISA|nr:Glycerol kinase [Quillaja saponaria]
MALTTVNVIGVSQNKGLAALAFPCSTKFSSRNYHSESSFQLMRQSNIQCTAIFTGASSSVAKTTESLSDAEDSFNATSPATSWSQFARNVSGEWDGFGADFSNEGKPIELPESVVPEAYREWEVKLFDWQTQCPTLAEPEEEQHVLVYKSIKLLPTVGCEADAATRYNVNVRNVGGVKNRVTAFTYQSSGCYVAVWPGEEDQKVSSSIKKLMELEHCLISPQDRESRVRIIQVVRIDDKKIVLQSIRVFREQWYGPFRNGEQLGGCAIHDSAFATTAPMTASELNGIWQGPRAVTTFDGRMTDFLQEALDDSMQKSVRDGCNVVFLPKQLWCLLKQNTDGEISCEVGWLVDKGHAITSRCILSGTGEVKEISIACETRGLQGV